jgi:hypothetical protein
MQILAARRARKSELRIPRPVLKHLPLPLIFALAVPLTAAEPVSQASHGRVWLKVPADSAPL